MDRASREVVYQIADVAGAVLWGGVSRDADFFSDRWLRSCGETREAWIARGWESAIHAEDRAPCVRAWHESMAHRHVGDIEVRIQMASGEHRWHRVRFVTASELWFGIAFDLEPVRAFELKDHFLAAVSHELRAPIAAVLLWERLLREPDLGADERRRALDAIHDSAMAQSRLVDDLIDVARITTGKLAVRLEPVRIIRILDRALEEVRPAIATKQQELVVDIASDLGSVLADSSRLVQVIVNLLTNAIKFTPLQGRVTLSARRLDSEITIEVTDTGCGIEPEFLPRVFDLFSQSERGSTGGDVGLGLGLAIASELIELHHGTLAAYSEGAGQGARFVLRLPATEHRASTPIPTRNPERVIDGISVLVVDDDTRVLEALEVLLSRAGAIVTCAESVDEAWAALGRNTPDIVVSDIGMPFADGYQLVRRMRGSPALSHVPAIALTAYAASGDIQRARTEGFDLHMSKPVRLDQLVAGIARLVSR